MKRRLAVCELVLDHVNDLVSGLVDTVVGFGVRADLRNGVFDGDAGRSLVRDRDLVLYQVVHVYDFDQPFEALLRRTNAERFDIGRLNADIGIHRGSTPVDRFRGSGAGYERKRGEHDQAANGCSGHAERLTKRTHRSFRQTLLAPMRKLFGEGKINDCEGVRRSAGHDCTRIPPETGVCRTQTICRHVSASTRALSRNG
jgi:hypothetical protein